MEVWLPVLETGGLGLWLPPTPPRGAGDLFMDQSPPGYHRHIMPESSLPPVTLRAQRPKRMRLTSTGEGERTRHSEEALVVPRSLFDRGAPASSNTLRFKREFTMHKFRSPGRTPTGIRSGSSPGSVSSMGGSGSTKPQDDPRVEWSQQEDATVLLYLGLCGQDSPHPAHIANWDLLCDQVNKVSRLYRSPRACRSRYDIFLSKVSNVNQKQLPDGSSPVASSCGSSSVAADNARLVALASAGMANRGLPKTKSRGSSSSINNMTDNSDFCSESIRRIESVKRVKNQLAPTVKPLTLAVSAGSGLRNSKNNQILTQAGIAFDSPLSPEQIASTRPERMKEKQKLLDQSRQNNAQQLLQPHQILQQPGVHGVAGGAVLQQQPAQQQLLAQQHQQHTATLPQQHVSASSVHQHHHQQQQILGSVVVSRNAVVVSSAGQSAVAGLLTTAATIAGAVPLPATVTTAVGSSGSAASSVVPSSGTNIGTPQVVTVASLASGLIATANIASNSSSSTAAALLTSGASTTVRPIAASVPLAVSSIGTGPRTTKLTAALQELRPQTQGATVVSMTPLAQIQAAAKFSQPIQVTGIQTKAGVSGPRTLTPSQLTYIHPPQAIKRLQIGASTAAGQKIPVAVSGASLQGIAAIQVSQASRGQMLKHGGAAVVSVTTSAAALLPQQSKTLTRTVTEAEMTAIIRRQQQQQQHAKAGSLTQMGSIALSSASLLASGANIITTGSSASAGTSVATILKAAGAVSTQSSSSLTLSAKQQLQQRVTAATTVMKGTTVGLQLGTKGSSGASSLGTLQIIQGAPGQKTGGMQQIQVFKQVNPQTVHHLASASAHGGTVLTAAKNVSSNAAGTTKLLPASVSHQGIRQTIQVVSAGGSLVGTPGSGGTIRVSGAGTGSPTLTLPASAVRMATPQLLSQVSAALQQGQTVTVPVRGTSTAGGAPASVRISQPITVQPQQLALQQVQQQQQATQLSQSQQQPSTQS